MTPTPPLPTGITFFQRDWLSSNNILLSQGSEHVLIDSGYATHAEMTLSLLKTVIGSTPLNRLINTHLHSDHCGGNARLQEQYPELKTLIPPGHFEAVTRWSSEDLSYKGTGQTCPRFHAEGTLLHAHTYEWAGKPWTAFAAPGHDPHAFIYYCPSEGILISGDALWEHGFGIIFPELTDESGFAETAQTLDLIESLQAALVIPGHGRMFADVPAALSRARERLKHFSTYPDKHARHAGKVLLKFKLQEFGSISWTAFAAWAVQNPYLVNLHQRVGGTMELSDWVSALVSDLVQNGTVEQQSDLLVNIG